LCLHRLCGIHYEIEENLDNKDIRKHHPEITDAILNDRAALIAQQPGGQSMMIAGLLSNQMGSSVSKMPGAGDIPVLGALFKSNGWRRNETELMIVITPYLVKPVSESQLVLPTDGLHSPNDLERVFLGKMSNDKRSKTRPMPSIAPTVSNGPELGSVGTSAPNLGLAPQLPASASAASATSGPGFSFDN
jgi:pilus assembly protein CpaC